MSSVDEIYSVDCPFCAIARAYPAPSFSEDVILAVDDVKKANSKISNASTNISGNGFKLKTAPAAAEKPQAHVILNTPSVLAFLDHAPISRGHVLVIAREHRPKLSDCLVTEAQALGAWLPVISRAVMKAVATQPESTSSSNQGGSGSGGIITGNTDDVHALAPSGNNDQEGNNIGDWNIVQNNGAIPEVKARSWTIFGRGQRQDLDDEDAEILVRVIRKRLAYEIDRVGTTEGVGVLASLSGTQASGRMSQPRGLDQPGGVQSKL